MDPTIDFRQRLVRRFVWIALIGVPSSVVAGAGCGNDVENTSTSTTSGSSNSASSVSGQGSLAGPTSMGSGTFETTECFAWPQAGAGGGGGGLGGGGGQGGSAGQGGDGGQGGASIPPCPSIADAFMYLTPNGCGGEVISPGTFAEGQCCYQFLNYDCGVGRPFVVEGQVRTAERGQGRSEWEMQGAPRPQVADLSDEERAFLVDAWARDALLEHASVASFGRFAMELLAVAAPPELVEMAHRAALDEVRHARLCFGLASAYGAQAITPGAFPFDGRVEVSAHLPTIAARTVTEGCIGETLASVLAAEASARATDPAVRQVLAAIAEDEARHAELAWRTVAWAIARGGTDVREAVAQAFAAALAGEPAAQGGAPDDSLAGHGRLSTQTQRDAMKQALTDVVRPAAAALLRERRAAQRPLNEAVGAMG